MPKGRPLLVTLQLLLWISVWKADKMGFGRVRSLTCRYAYWRDGGKVNWGGAGIGIGDLMGWVTHGDLYTINYRYSSIVGGCVWNLG